ncbi:ABC transporter permease [Oenococcus oeni]|uniref:ABC transporter permease n=2 Tax=Oenococcus oeni TaxID=1247 RepID=UPI000277BC88|nr:ABC transporter permease [Oenococcus oeni]EJO05517.1 ABC transporter permease [Oenococcus oeni AWRIB548]EJO05688.1 ABC transporter permease [Oenococcus oeni AWRIB422]KEP86760.1 ABC transporter permease [Oenococcus oeni IOEB_0205]OIL91981.1 ABC transporter permease [Oenococcus oeni]OIL99376.1 ABC transporter permease [Oenococcus oeni]
MDKIFNRRRELSFQRNFRYLSRAFNDQFIGFLFIAVALLGYEYLHNLNSIHGNWLTILLVLFASSSFLFFGDLSTYIQNADQIFLIADLPDLKKYLKKSFLRSLLLNILLQFFLNLLLMPILLKIFGLVISLIYLFLFLLAKTFLLILKYRNIVKDNRVDWTYGINSELRRVNRINIFLNFFTDVKELKHDNRPTKIWDWLIKCLPQFNQSFHWILFTRYFFRSRQFMPTIILTTFFGMALAFFLPSLSAATISGLFIVFALAYQMKPIFSYYSNHKMAQVYQRDGKRKLTDFQLLAVAVFVPIVLLLLLSLLASHRKVSVLISILLIISFTWVIICWYLPRLVGFKYEIKK